MGTSISTSSSTNPVPVSVPIWNQNWTTPATRAELNLNLNPDQYQSGTKSSTSTSTNLSSKVIIDKVTNTKQRGDSLKEVPRFAPQHRNPSPIVPCLSHWPPNPNRMQFRYALKHPKRSPAMPKR